MMTAHCIPCIYRRYLGGNEYYCAYYLDTGKKLPCPGGDGCTARLILPPAEREAYLREHREPLFATFKTDRDYHDDDYIFDSRGTIDGWYKMT
jgi:hypothetical protein